MLTHPAFFLPRNHPADEPSLNGRISPSSRRIGESGPIEFNTDPDGETTMNKRHEKLLIATLAGLVITAAAAFAVSPAMAAGYFVDAPARVSGVAKNDVLNMRKWPASYSRLVGELSPKSTVWVIRCIEKGDTSDWCLVERGDDSGWVNSRFIELLDEDWDI